MTEKLTGFTIGLGIAGAIAGYALNAHAFEFVSIDHSSIDSSFGEAEILWFGLVQLFGAPLLGGALGMGVGRFIDTVRSGQTSQ